MRIFRRVYVHTQVRHTAHYPASQTMRRNQTFFFLVSIFFGRMTQRQPLFSSAPLVYMLLFCPPIQSEKRFKKGTVPFQVKKKKKRSHISAYPYPVHKAIAVDHNLLFLTRCDSLFSSRVGREFSLTRSAPPPVLRALGRNENF